MTRIEQAQQLAHEAHDSIGQKRKYNGEPYWVHTDAVAQLVADHGGSEAMVIAAHLHDVIEDVYPLNKKYSITLIQDIFGFYVATLVIGATDVFTKEDYPKLNRAQRKQAERERVAAESPELHTIKLADFINNTESIVQHDKDFAKVYLKEKLAMLPALSDGNPVLLQRATMQTIAGFSALGLTLPTFSS